MRRDLIGNMQCPYCLGHFTVTQQLEEDAGHIRWGLLRCRCFEFPIVDGVLLLSLAKGYGGSEEILAPYVPLQVAAIEYLRAGDVPGLRRWIERHIPLLHHLISSDPIDYMTFTRELHSRLGPQVEKDLFSWNRYEVLGRRGAHRRRRGLINAFATTRVGSWMMRARRRLFPQVWSSFYVSRFVGNELVGLRARLGGVPITGPVLSLCCGHGPFEFLLRGRNPTVPIVSIDGQLLNLFVVKRFVAPDSSYICHDVQFPLPFKNGVFSEVFSSTCLSEIPSQALFIREARRVTSNTGWTMFDTVTPDAEGRVAPIRFYRVCQNHFESLEDYRKLMLECADGRSLHFTPLDVAQRQWTDGAMALADAACATFVYAQQKPGDVQSGEPGAFSADERSSLAVNPRYRVQTDGATLLCRLGFSERVTTKLKIEMFAALPDQTVIDRQKLDDPAYLDGLFASGVIVLLPNCFSENVVKLFPAAAAQAT